MTTQAPTREQIRDAWESLAPGFDRYVTPMSIEQGGAAIGRLELRPGTRFLDVAAGSGALAIPAARRGADVVAVDIAPTMIERLTSRARAEGLSKVDGRVMDCHALEFPDASFDITASQNGVTMSARLPVALAEMVRVTRPGGTVLVVAFSALRKAEFIALFVGAVRAAVPDLAVNLPTDAPPPPFQLADPETFRSRLREAGLTDVIVDTVTWDMPIESADELWHKVTCSNPIGAQLVAGLNDAQRDNVRKVLDGMLRERSGGRPGAHLLAEVNIGTGTR